MVKFRKGNKLVIGLSEENIKRLKLDQPIKFNLKELGLSDIDVFIIYGNTEQDIFNELKGSIDIEKTVFIDPNAANN